VDLVIESGNRLLPVEIKAGRTPGSDFFRGLEHYTALSGARSGVLIYGGDESYRLQVAFYTVQDFVLHAGPPYDCSNLNYPPLCGALPGHRMGGDVEAFLLVLLAPLGLTGLLRRRRQGGNRCRC
jgi:hypothetical protein